MGGELETANGRAIPVQPALNDLRSRRLGARFPVPEEPSLRADTRDVTGRARVPESSADVVRTPPPAPDRSVGTDSGGDGAITISRVSSIGELEGLREPWDALLRQSPASHLFLSHDWVCTWWKHFGGDRRLFTLVFRRDDRILGIAPLLLERRRRRGIPVRQIGLLLNGCAQQSGLIFPAQKRDVFRAFVRHLQDCADQWDLVDLNGIPELSGDLPEIEAAAEGSSISVVRRWQFETLSLEYRGRPEVFMKSRTAHFRKRLKAAEKHLHELGSVALRRYTSPEDLESGFSRLLDVERRSWKLEGGTAILNQPGWLEFYRDVIGIFGRKAGCQIRVIEIDGSPVASILVIVYDGVVYALRIFIDQSLSRASLGNLMMHFLMTDAWTPEIRAIDFDRRTPFISRWSNRSDVYHGVFLFHGGFYPRFLRRLQSLSSAARSLWKLGSRNGGREAEVAD